MQIVDLSPGFKEIFNGKIYLDGNKLKDSIWNIIPNHYNTVRILERTNTSDLYFKMPDYLGRNGFKKTDIFNAARVNRVKLEEGTYKTTKKISNKITDSNAVYLSNKIQHARYLKYIFQNDSNYHFYFRDGIWILTDKKIIEKNNPQGSLNNKLIYGNILLFISAFLKKKVAEEFKFIEDRKLAGSEDYFLWLQIITKYYIFNESRISEISVVGLPFFEIFCFAAGFSR